MKDAARHETPGLPIACRLSGSDLETRRRDLCRVAFGDAMEVMELEDGYEFVFPGSPGMAMRVVEIVVAGRSCCPFFAFDLHFEPGGGRILLRVRGPEETKEFIMAELGLPGAGAEAKTDP